MGQFYTIGRDCKHGSPCFHGNAHAIVQHAFVQEHFAAGGKSETGVIVMNIYKANGTQFDGVLNFEGLPSMNK